METFAAVVGAISVYLSVRQNIWSWPTAIVNVLLYTIVFYDAKLYADMGLQVIYAGLSVYGWYEWLHGGENRSALRVTRTSAGHWAIFAFIGVGGASVLGLILRRYTDAALPFMDASLSSTSLIAQFMMTRKKLENWILWIIADVLYVGMFTFKHLYTTSALYFVFLILAVRGYIDWRNSEREYVIVPSLLPE